MVNHRRFTTERRRKCSPHPRRFAALFDTCEERVLLAANGFLQGIALVSGPNQPLAGATILLHKIDAPAIADQSVTTDASGSYLFQGLPGGQYRLTETPPTGYVNNQTQVNSPLTKVLGTTSRSIDVQIGDPSKLLVSYPSRNKEIITSTNNGTTHESLVGQSNITVSQPDIPYTSPLFSSFCVDFYRDIRTGDQNLPYSMEPLSTALANDPQVKNPQNAGAIAYLYNHVGSTWSTDPAQYVSAQQAAGLQLAIWELEYETSGTYNVLDGSFRAQGLTSTSPEVIAAQNDINIALGKNERAVYLNGLPTDARPAGSQALIAPMAIDFTNDAIPPTPGIGLTKFTNGVHDTNPNGNNLVLVNPGSPVTWTYQVANTGNVPFAKASVIVTDNVDSVHPAYSSGDVNTNGILDPGETWTYTATGAALNLSGPLPPTVVVVPGGDPNGTGDTRAVYRNTGRVAIADTTLTASDISHYANFPTPPPAALALFGTVFEECDNDGVQQASLDENGLPNVVVTLNGTDNSGTPISMTTTTDTLGHYSFDLTNHPGVYTVTQTVPAGLIFGKSTPGEAGGTPTGVSITNIHLTSTAGNYNFADLTPCSLSGVVYYDLNHDKAMGPTDFGIAHVIVNLSGTDDLGHSVHMTSVTDKNGVFSFTGLRPGTYDVVRTQPSLFRKYNNTVGSLGGTVTPNSFTDISVPGCAEGTGYLFGELQRPTCRLRHLAISVGNTFYHYQRTYQRDPAAFAKTYPNLTPSIAKGEVPWGKGPFPLAPVASHWVPTLGTKPIVIYPVHAASVSTVRPSSMPRMIPGLSHVQALWARVVRLPALFRRK